MNDVKFFKCLADNTRLQILLLLREEKELCVCELTHALALSQPKISRHIALLKTLEILSHRKVGKWVYYRLSENMPQTYRHIINLVKINPTENINDAIQRLNAMSGRPDSASICCE